MTKERILVVEDDKHISRLVRYNLGKAGFDTIAAGDGQEALEALDRHGVDLVILDIMLPKIDGLEVLKRLKQLDKLKNIPVLMLTAKAEEVDRVVGLELGADDYVTKPFSPRELVLRVKAVLKRGKSAEATPKEIIEKGDLFVDIARHRVSVKNKEVELTNKEFQLLLTLIQRQGRIQSRDRLLEDIWDIHSDVYTRTVDTHIKRLREKLGRMGVCIETVRGMGYRFREEDED